ncbi:hypothetical protein BJ508DRAFT_337051 [Ascobolus immersus RN42]|uniref:Uncharacterized protein n=1 Tax=Ascobolus immersus RN42 TaxID=1160509 RepID=A0A3N4H6H1_ASCIM|nr:hypothetical protein BJ508DRAFT_337051 [Ascobolus immersus RN42]
MPWNELSETENVSEEFMANTAIFALLKKRVNGVRSQLFYRSRAFFAAYFNLDNLDSDARVRWCIRLLHENAYNCRLDVVERTPATTDEKLPGRFVSIINSLFVPFIYEHWFQSKQSLGIDDPDRFLAAISLELLCVYKPGRGFGDMLGKAKSVYNTHLNTLANNLDATNQRALLSSIRAGVKVKMSQENGYVPKSSVLCNKEALQQDAIRDMIAEEFGAINRDQRDLDNDIKSRAHSEKTRKIAQRSTQNN